MKHNYTGECPKSFIVQRVPYVIMVFAETDLGVEAPFDNRIHFGKNRASKIGMRQTLHSIL